MRANHPVDRCKTCSRVRPQTAHRLKRHAASRQRDRVCKVAPPPPIPSHLTSSKTKQFGRTPICEVRMLKLSLGTIRKNYLAEPKAEVSLLM